MENHSIDDLVNEQIDEQEPEWLDLVGSGPSDPVNHPSWYKWHDMEVIDVVQKVLTTEEYLGYLKGTDLVYRLRAGKKDTIFQDIQKGLKYEQFYNDFVKKNTP